MEKIKYHPLRTTFSEVFRIASRINPPCVYAEAVAGYILSVCSEEKLSFKACLMSIIADVQKDHPFMNGILGRSMFGKSIFIPEKTDIALIEERFIDGTAVPVLNIINDCGNKSVNIIERDIQHLANLSPHNISNMKPLLSLSRLPAFIQYFYLLIRLRSPLFFNRLFGTAGVIDMSGFNVTSMYPLFIQTAVFGIGAITHRPVFEKEENESVAVIPLSLAFNHCILDGAEVARILVSVKQRIEDEHYVDKLVGSCR